MGAIFRVALLAAALLMPGCAWLDFYGTGGRIREGQSSSMVEFLYPDGAVPPPVDDTVPTLNVPLRVGLAFVPSGAGQSEALTEALKAELLERVRESFQEEEFIRGIEVIPENYLRGGKGFATLQQVGRLYDLDVMALVSYDQVAMSEDSAASVLYWTIIGAYVVKGTRNEVRTFVDTAVFDLPTRRLLFRAPGSDSAVRSATLVESPQKMRSAQEASFGRAMEDMTTNLRVELARFQERIETEGVARVAHRDGSSGGAGRFGAGWLLAMLAGAAWTGRQKRRRRHVGRTTPGCPASAQ